MNQREDSSLIKETKSVIEKISFLDQTDKEKEKIAETVIRDSKSDNLYWIEITLSIMIATVGLLQNSVAVIIGAMLIAPLTRPMIAMSFGIARGTSSFFWRATGFLTRSVAISIIIGYFLASFIPLKIETSEILARTSPNILDFFIAIFSAVVALLALRYTRLSSSVAGVAMAASLIPPLAVVGIELSLANYSLAWGSFLLFFINFLAILLIGVGMFMFYGFTPHQEFQKKMSFRKIYTLILIILFTAIPLYSSFANIILEVKTEKEAYSFLSKEIENKISQASLKNLDIIKVDDKKIKMKGTIQIPENIIVYKSTYNSILQSSEKHFGKEIDLNFEMIRTANLSTPDKNVAKKSQLLLELNNQYIKSFPDFKILQTNLKNTEKNSWSVNTVISVPSGEFLTSEKETEFQSLISSTHEDLNLSFSWTTVAGAEKYKKEELSKNQIIQKDITANLQELLTQPQFKSVKMENISVSIDDKTQQINLEMKVFYNIQNIPQSQEDSQKKESQSDYEDRLNKEIKKSLQSLLYNNISAKVDFISYSQKTINVND